MRNLLIVFIASFSFLVSFAQDTRTINLAKGQKYSVETVMSTTSNSEMMGQSIDSKANITSVYSIAVDGVANDRYQLTNTISHITMNASAMGQDMDFDSDKKEDMDGEIGKNFKDLINVPHKVEMDKSGNIIVPKDTDTTSMDKGGGPASMMIGQMLGDPAESGYGAKMAFQTLPKNAKPGTSWKDSTSDNGIEKVTHYTVKEMKGDEAIIQMDGTVTTDMKTEMQGMEVLTKAKGKFTGQQTVDIKKGILKTSTIDTDASGTVTLMGQDVPNTSKVKAVTTVKQL